MRFEGPPRPPFSPGGPRGGPPGGHPQRPDLCPEPPHPGTTTTKGVYSVHRPRFLPKRISRILISSWIFCVFSRESKPENQ